MSDNNTDPYNFWDELIDDVSPSEHIRYPEEVKQDSIEYLLWKEQLKTGGRVLGHFC